MTDPIRCVRADGAFALVAPNPTDLALWRGWGFIPEAELAAEKKRADDAKKIAKAVAETKPAEPVLEPEVAKVAETPAEKPKAKRAKAEKAAAVEA